MQVNRFGYYWLDTWVLANIEEGNLRHSTSKETEMRLTDVARASLSELANLEGFIDRGQLFAYPLQSPHHDAWQAIRESDGDVQGRGWFF